ncbi:MAG: CBS domain-containing protein [Nitrospirota bacterium]|nr:CBS domain-containing protein [Nitrospirota bacterium]
MRKTEFLVEACDPKVLTVGEMMQDAVFTCNSRSDALTISRLMTHRNFGSLPVVKGDRTLVGLVSEHDLLQAIIEGRDLRKVKVVKIMNSKPVTVTEDIKLEEVANLFKDRHLIRVPVVRKGKLVGILSRRDVLFGYNKASLYRS